MQYESRRREFEAWLCRENERLSGIPSTKGATLSANELKIRKDTLKVSSCSTENVQEAFLDPRVCSCTMTPTLIFRVQECRACTAADWSVCT